MAHGNPRLAAGVDYLVIPHKDASLVPSGFLADGRSPHYLRFRRGATTLPAPADCF